MKIMYFGSYLDGLANRFDNQGSTWDKIKEDFLEEFALETDDLVAQNKFDNRQQGIGESIRNYYYDLRTLVYDYDPDTSDKGFIKQFERGMSKALFPWYITMRSTTITVPGLKEIVEKLNDIETEKTVETK